MKVTTICSARTRVRKDTLCRCLNVLRIGKAVESVYKLGPLFVQIPSKGLVLTSTPTNPTTCSLRFIE